MGFRMTAQELEHVRHAKAVQEHWPPPTVTAAPLAQPVYGAHVAGGKATRLQFHVQLYAGKGRVQVAANLLTTARVGMQRRLEEALISVGYGPPEDHDALVSVEGAGAAILDRSIELPACLAVAQHLGAVLYCPTMAFGALLRDGTVVPTLGTVAAAVAAQRDGLPLLCHPDTAGHAALAGGEVVTAAHLSMALAGGDSYYGEATLPDATPEVDMAVVKGQSWPRFALEVAAAGGHGLMFVGPPGQGKTLLARCLPGILPPLTDAERLEVACLREAHGELNGGPIGRPFVAVGKDASVQGVTGGGSRGQFWPGAVTAAHKGVLFIDEFPTLQSSVVEALRVPLEQAVVRLQRSGTSVVFPADFQLLAGANPCKCGPRKGGCTCTPALVRNYRNGISGPIEDRIDLRVTMERLSADEVHTEAAGESTADVQVRVLDAVARQQRRYRGEVWRTNASIPPGQCERTADCTNDAWALLTARIVNPRRWDKTLRVARTVADLRGHTRVEKGDAADAVKLCEGGFN